MIVAWVDGVPLPRSRVDAELRRMYAGPDGTRLPDPGTAEGRQLRRWVIQVLAVVSVLAHEAHRRGLSPAPAGSDSGLAGPDPGPGNSAADGPGGILAAGLGASAAAELGSIAMAALARSPQAAALVAAIAGGAAIGQPDVDAFLAANPDLVAEETRLVRHVRAGRPVNGGRPYRIRRCDLLGDLVFAAAPGAVVEHGPDVVTVLDAAGSPRPDIAGSLLDAARGRAVARWLGVQLRERVVLAPGSEHPADPAQPDHTHRH